MEVISKKLICRRAREHTYTVLVNVWVDTPENRQFVYDMCDAHNFGGWVNGFRKEDNGILLVVDVYID